MTQSLRELLSGTSIAEPHAEAFQTLLTEALGLSSTGSKIRFTPEGGLAVRMLNGTGGASVKGTVVTCSATADRTVIKHPAGNLDPFGIIYENGTAVGEECWVVVSGMADVLLEDGTACVSGNWVAVSNTVAGRCQAEASAPPPSGIIEEIQEHFKEVGHCLETKSSGTDVLALCVLHFN